MCVQPDLGHVVGVVIGEGLRRGGRLVVVVHDHEGLAGQRTAVITGRALERGLVLQEQVFGAGGQLDAGTLGQQVVAAETADDLIIGQLVVLDLDDRAADDREQVGVAHQRGRGVKGQALRHDVEVRFAVHHPEQAAGVVHVLGDGQLGHQGLHEGRAGGGVDVKLLHVGGVQVGERLLVGAPPGGLGGGGQAGRDADRGLGAGAEQDGLVQRLGDGDGDRAHDLAGQGDVAVLEQSVAHDHGRADLITVHLGLVKGQVDLVDVGAHLGPYGLGDLAHHVHASGAAHPAQGHIGQQLALAGDLLAHQAQHGVRDQQAGVVDGPLFADRAADLGQEILHAVIGEEIPGLFGGQGEKLVHNGVAPFFAVFRVFRGLGLYGRPLIQFVELALQAVDLRLEIHLGLFVLGFGLVGVSHLGIKSRHLGVYRLLFLFGGFTSFRGQFVDQGSHFGLPGLQRLAVLFQRGAVSFQLFQFVPLRGDLPGEQQLLEHKDHFL